MTTEKKHLLNKIELLLTKRTTQLLSELPDIHEVNDGIVARFFGEWDNCDSAGVNFKIIDSTDPNESNVFFFIPQDSSFDLTQQYHIGSILCFDGEIEFTVKNEKKIVTSYTKTIFNTDMISGHALKNTYLLVTSDRRNWSDEITKKLKKYR